jgi:hypothetical protein
VVNLDVIAPGQYFAHGTYGFSESASRLPLAAEFMVKHLPNTLSIDGHIQREGTTQRHAFSCLFQRDDHSQSQATVLVTFSSISHLAGRVSLVGPTVEVLACDLAANVALSARILSLEKKREYEVSGLLSLLGQGWFPFHLRAVPNEDRAAFANVVGIAGKSGGEGAI